MSRSLFHISFKFILLLAVQVVVLNNLHLGSYWHPMLYVLFILTLPINTPGWLLLLLSFIMGISVDIFTQTPGMHASATVLTAYIRPFILKLMAPREDYDPELSPGINNMGLKWFVSYAGILLAVHHLFLFYVEAFRLSGALITLLRTLCTFSFSMLLLVLVQLLFQRRA